MTKKQKKVEKNFKAGLKNFFSSASPIIITLMVLVAILIWFSYHLMSINKTYMFSGKSEYLSIVNGVISLNYDVNVFEGSDITYIAEKDYTVTKYEIGYYLAKNKDLTPFLIRTGQSEKGVSLKEIISEVSVFNVNEPYWNKVNSKSPLFTNIFTKENVKELEDGLVFIIKATTKDGKEINDRVNISLTKVSK